MAKLTEVEVPSKLLSEVEVEVEVMPSSARYSSCVKDKELVLW